MCVESDSESDTRSDDPDYELESESAICKQMIEDDEDSGSYDTDSITIKINKKQQQKKKCIRDASDDEAIQSPNNNKSMNNNNNVKKEENNNNDQIVNSALIAAEYVKTHSSQFNSNQNFKFGIFF